MKHAFNIYPALFILTPVQRAEAALVEGNECNDDRAWAREEERYFTSYPQTYWGNCLLNASRTQLILPFSKGENKGCPVFELNETPQNLLQPAKFRGNRYTITYLPVLN